MRQPKFTFALAGSLLLALALGCQTPVAPLAPKVAVSYGSLQWSSDADLAVLLDLRPLLQARKLQAASATVLGPVTTIVAKVTGPNIVGEIVSPEVHTWECPGGLATLNFAHLPEGEVTVVVNAFDANHNLVKFTPPMKAQIHAGQVAEVTVTCADANGQLVVHFGCPELCDGSPAPAPSPTPTPTPVPTPTPTPPPADPRPVMNFVTGFNVDAHGNLYLFGLDPNPTDVNAPGAILQIPPTLQVPRDLFFRKIDPIFEGEIQDETLYAATSAYPPANHYDEVGLKLALNNPGASTPFNISVARAFTGAWFGNTIRNVNGNWVMYFEPGALNGTGLEQTFEIRSIDSPPTDASGLNNYYFRQGSGAGARAVSMSWDAVRDQLVWSSMAGIYTWDSRQMTPNAPTTAANSIHQIVDGPTYGLAPLPAALQPADSFGFVYTKLTDGTVYSNIPGWAPITPDPSLFAYRTELGADGKLYVMLTKALPSGGTPLYLREGGSDHYKIMRLDLAPDGTLLSTQTLVDTLN